jgi:hypothetical protein
VERSSVDSRVELSSRIPLPHLWFGMLSDDPKELLVYWKFDIDNEGDQARIQVKMSVESDFEFQEWRYSR